MTEQEHLLACLAEECAEIQLAIARALRLGLDQSHSATKRTHFADIVAGLDNLEGIASLLRDLYHFPETDQLAVMRKRLKVGTHLEYAKARTLPGTIETERVTDPASELHPHTSFSSQVRATTT